MRTNKAACLMAVNDLRYIGVPFPKRGEDEVLLKVKSCGICGSDLARVFKKGTYRFPTVIGHEFSGEIADADDEALIGKRAAVFPLLPCFGCESCKHERYATCENYDYYGSRRDGGMAEYIAVKKWNVLIMPDGLSFDEGAMCEPASVARHAVKKLGIKEGESVLITGAGTIGLIAGQWARSFGAKRVMYVDTDPRKTAAAERMGFFKYSGEAVGAFLEGTGASGALVACLKAARPHARGVLMGNPGGEIELSQDEYWCILRKELKLSGTWNSSCGEKENDWRESLSAMAEGRIDVKSLITHRFPLSECNKAFSMMKNGDEFFIKVMLNMNVEAEE